MQKTLKVQGMSCKCCVNSIEESINQLESVSSVDIDFTNKEVHVAFADGETALEKSKEVTQEQKYRIV